MSYKNSENLTVCENQREFILHYECCRMAAKAKPSRFCGESDFIFHYGTLRGGFTFRQPWGRIATKCGWAYYDQPAAWRWGVRISLFLKKMQTGCLHFFFLTKKNQRFFFAPPLLSC